MEQNNTFIFNYSAKMNAEVLAIREKYLPRKETKLEELKRLDDTVQAAGMIEALSTGICGMLVFGLGFCLSMQVIGTGAFLLVLGFLLAFLGLAGMLAAYPIYRKIFTHTKNAHAPRILELVAELSGEPNDTAY